MIHIAGVTNVTAASFNVGDIPRREGRAKQRTTVLHHDSIDPHMSLDEQYKNYKSKPEIGAERNLKRKIQTN